MSKKTQIQSNIPLFDDNETRSVEKTKSTKNDNTDNKRKSKSNSNNNVYAPIKENKNSVRKSKKVDDDNTKIDAKSKSKRSTDIKGSKTSRTKTESISNTDSSVDKNDKEKLIKTGRKTRKNNWWNGCDYVWVDGIDHWVSKTAFRNDKNTKPVYTLNNYVPGLDSYYCLFIYKPSEQKSKSQKNSETTNKELTQNKLSIK